MSNEVNSQQKKILVVEDDELFRHVIRSLLESKGHMVREAENGLVAKTILELTPFDLVISDVRMPVMDGLELLSFIKKTSTAKVILITGFSEIIETQQAYERGADQFLPKPFKREELIKAFEKCFPSNSTNVGHQDADFCQVLITDFVSGSALPTDIYMRLAENHFIKLASYGQSVPTDRIELYRSKGIHYLYMLKRDFAQYVGFNLKLLNAISDQASLGIERKRGLIRHVTDTLSEQLFRLGLEKDRLEHASLMVMNSMEIFFQNRDLSKLVDNLLTTNSAPDHNISVAMISCMMAQEMNWNSQSTLFKVTLAGLFHDIGKKEIPEELLMKERIDLTAAEKQLVESHTIRGRDILAAIPGLPEDVASVAAQHHESMSGSGYPYGLRGDAIHPLARLVACANTFCEMIAARPNDETAMSSVQIYDRLKYYHAQDLDSTFVAALGKIVKGDTKKAVA